MKQPGRVFINDKMLNRLAKQLKEPMPRLLVGIMGAKNIRKKETDIDNASVGVTHEFGSPSEGIPKRSFLRMPLSLKLNSEISGFLPLPNSWQKKLVTRDGWDLFMRKTGALSLKIIKSAFQTRGFGTWKPWRNKNYSNNAGMVLVDTTQLRDSITFRIEE